MEERLQKIIARAGIASRRHAEEMIASGLVTVNGHTITELGSKADPDRDHIKVGGKLIRPEKARVYLILNKPPEVVSTMSDPEGRRSLRDLLQGVTERVFPVGRLEYHAYGLVFLTNDGDLANSILQSHHLPQTYQIKLKSLLTFAEIEELSRATGARISRRGGQSAPWYEVTTRRSAPRCAARPPLQVRPSRRKNEAHRARKSRTRLAPAGTASRTFGWRTLRPAPGHQAAGKRCRQIASSKAPACSQNTGSPQNNGPP